MKFQDWVQLLSVGTNISLLMIGIRLIRFISRMELKVDTMWDDYLGRRHGSSLGEQ